MTLLFLHKSERFLALLYLGLMLLHLPLFGPFFAEDILAPFLAFSLIRRYPNQLPCDAACKTLAVFLGIIGVITLLHFLGGGETGYNFCVLLYLGSLFLYFRSIPFTEKQLFLYGGGCLLLFFLGWLPELIRACGISLPETGLCFISDNVQETALTFLSRRYSFLFKNPNILGAFYPLPLTMLFLGLSTQYPNASPKKKALVLCLLFLAFLPLLHTLSKHILISIALTLAFLLKWICPSQWQPKLRWPAILTLLFLGLAFEMTVLFVVFPLKKQAPYFNTIGSPYAIHQKAYAKLSTRSLSSLLIGNSPQTIRETYPKMTDRTNAEKTLKQYNALHLLDMYLSFMDPHNEYLNLMSLYGLLALLGCVIFAVGIYHSTPSPLLFFFLLALAIACLWDDLLSKRWIWITLALLCPSSCNTPQAALQKSPQAN